MLIIAGIGQVVLALGSVAIPRVLKWKEEVVKLRPLIRQLFWTYASFILMAKAPTKSMGSISKIRFQY